jgi:hypothetical protein
LRLVRGSVIQLRREKEAVIKIQRSVSPMKVRRKKELEMQRTEKMSTIISVRLWEETVEFAIADSVGILAAELAEEERIRMEEENRQHECLRMAAAEDEMRIFLIQCVQFSEMAVVACTEDYIDNQIDTTAAYAYILLCEERQKTREEQERARMDAEEQRMREANKRYEIASMVAREKLATESVMILMEAWMESEIDMTYASQVPIAVHKEIRRQELEIEEKELQRQRAFDRTVQEFVNTVFLGALKLLDKKQNTQFSTSVKLVAPKKAPDVAASMKTAAVSPVPVEGKFVSPSTVSKKTPAPTVSPRKAADYYVDEYSSPKRTDVVVSSASSAVSIGLTAGVKVRTDKDILQDAAATFVNSLWRRPSAPNTSAPGAGPDEGRVARTLTGEEYSTPRSARSRQQQAADGDAMLVGAGSDVVSPDNYAGNDELSLKSTATVLELKLNSLSVEIETCLYGAEYSSTLASIESMRLLVLENKESGELTESKYEYYLTYSHLLMAECLIDIADYNEAIVLLELVLQSQEFMNTNISRPIVEDVAPHNNEGHAVAPSSATSISSLGSSVFTEIDVERKTRAWICMATIARALGQYHNVEPNLEQVRMSLFSGCLWFLL